MGIPALFLRRAIPLSLESVETFGRADDAPVTPFFEAGNVLLPHPEHCPWAREYIAELTQFPAAPHDDRMDVTTQVLTSTPDAVPQSRLSGPDHAGNPVAHGGRE